MIQTFASFSCDKPRYQVKVKCQWFYFKIRLFSQLDCPIIFFYWQVHSNQNVKWEHHR